MGEIIKGNLTFRTAGDQMVNMPAEFETDGSINIGQNPGTIPEVPIISADAIDIVEETLVSEGNITKETMTLEKALSSINIPSSLWNNMNESTQQSYLNKYNIVRIIDNS